MHFVNSGSIPDISKAREAQLVEQNIEAIWVVSSSLISSKIDMLELEDRVHLGWIGLKTVQVQVLLSISSIYVVWYNNISIASCKICLIMCAIMLVWMLIVLVLV